MGSKQVVFLGRWLFGAIFIVSGPTHFTVATQTMAAQRGVPPWLTMAAGAAAFLGGLSVALGYRARAGAWLLVLFLVPVTLVMHRFWGLESPQTAMTQFVEFFKNLSMLGGALMVTYFGSGPLSVDTMKSRPARPIESVRRREPTLR